MKLNPYYGLVSIFFVTSALYGAEPAASPSAHKTVKAEKAMLKACKKEFSEQVAGKTLDEVDHWAEGLENQADSAEFKKSRCFATHEAWEKLAQRNEWAETPAADTTRMPASSDPSH